MAYLHTSKGKDRTFSMKVLCPVKPLILITRRLGEQSSLRFILTALSILRTLKRSDCSHRIQQRVSFKDQPIPSSGPRTGAKLCPALQLHV